MEIVINTNILFPIANPFSVTRKLIENYPISLFSPRFALKEIKKYKEDIMRKAKINNFNDYINILKSRINFIKLAEYKDEIIKCKGLIKDEKDIEYIALALKFKMPLWTNDSLLKSQALVKILTTKDIINLLS